MNQDGSLSEHQVPVVLARKNFAVRRKLVPKEGKLCPCPIVGCLSGFARKGDLRSHFVEKHSNQLSYHPTLIPHDIFVCALCNQHFSRRHSFACHNRIHHDIIVGFQDRIVDHGKGDEYSFVSSDSNSTARFPIETAKTVAEVHIVQQHTPNVKMSIEFLVNHDVTYTT